MRCVKSQPDIALENATAADSVRVFFRLRLLSPWAVEVREPIVGFAQPLD